MSARACDQCGKHLVSQRRGARFCGEDCKNAWHNQNRRTPDRTDKRLAPVSGPQSGASGQISEASRGRLREPTDTERVLTALRARGTNGIHSHEIRKLAISGNPSQRIIDLEDQGYEIQHTREHKGRRPGVRYVLIAEPGQSLSEAA